MATSNSNLKKSPLRAVVAMGEGLRSIKQNV